jgi:hypothetical protein
VRTVSNWEKTMKEWDDSVPDGIKYLSAEKRVLTRKVRELESENARLKDAQRWIPVSERLPERDGFYLVLENVNQVAGYYHWCKVFGWNTDGGRTNIQSVTHWMPLPEPPEVKE